jgi:hypothetical protein
MSESRAPWYRCVIQCNGAHIDVTLSDQDEKMLFQTMLGTGTPFQVWAERWDGGAEHLTVIPGAGTRHVSRPARPIPVDAQGRPVGPDVQPAGFVKPTDENYGKIAKPARLIPLRWAPSETTLLLEALASLGRGQSLNTDETAAGPAAPTPLPAAPFAEPTTPERASLPEAEA